MQSSIETITICNGDKPVYNITQQANKKQVTRAFVYVFMLIIQEHNNMEMGIYGLGYYATSTSKTYCAQMLDKLCIK